MVKKLSIIILCVLLAAVAATAVVLGLSSEGSDNGIQAGTEQGTTDSTSSENNGSTGSSSSTSGGSSGNSSNSSSSSGSNGGSSSGNGSNSGGSTSSGSSVPVHTCNYVYFSNVTATCTAQGYDLYKCDVYPNCPNTTQKNVKKALGHDYKTTSVNNATCIADWSMTEECSRCSDVKVTTVDNSKTGHSYSWTTKQAATCTSDGLQEGVCSVCGATDYNTLTAPGHSYGAFISNGDATCTTDGTETAECSTCHDKVTQSAYGSMLGHLFENYIPATEKTCTQNETKKATCKRAGCNETDTKVTAWAEGHDYKLYSVLDGGGCGKLTDIKYKCDVCGTFETETKILEHDILQHGVCRWCGGYENPVLHDDEDGKYWTGPTYMEYLQFNFDGKECAPWEGCFGETHVWFSITSMDGDKLSFTVEAAQVQSGFLGGIYGFGAHFEYNQLQDVGSGRKYAEFKGALLNLETQETIIFRLSAEYRISDDGQYAEFSVGGSYSYQDDEGNEHWISCHLSCFRIILETV